MGVYLRSSLKAGPFRFNLSRSGIGVSAGVPGFRVGTGPRGNYVRVGARGVYYKATSRRSASGTVPAQRVSSPANVTLPESVAVIEIPTATVEELQGANPSELVEQLQAAARRHSVWPYAAVAALLVSAPLALLPLLILGPAVYWLYLRDRAQQRIVTFYDLEAEPAARYEALLSAAQSVAAARGNWAIHSSGAVRTTQQHKTNAGASQIVGRRATRLKMGGPRQLVTNIAVPSFDFGQTAVYLLPDRLLVRQGKQFADLPYTALTVTASPSKFIENKTVPKDAQQVGTTWQFVNVKGGPDRRYKNNPQRPIMLYGEIVFRTPTGMFLTWQCSRHERATEFAQALRVYVAPPVLHV